MTRFASSLVKLTGAAVLTLGSIVMTSTGFAATPPPPSTATGADLLAQAEHHAMMAAYYRARMRSDEKHAISWFTQANHCEQKAERLRVAAAQADSVRTDRG